MRASFNDVTCRLCLLKLVTEFKGRMGGGGNTQTWRLLFEERKKRNVVGHEYPSVARKVSVSNARIRRYSYTTQWRSWGRGRFLGPLPGSGIKGEAKWAETKIFWMKKKIFFNLKNVKLMYLNETKFNKIVLFYNLRFLLGATTVTTRPQVSKVLGKFLETKPTTLTFWRRIFFFKF